MSLIPLDEPRGDGPSPPREGRPTDTVFGRLWRRLTSAVRAFLSPVLGRSGETDDGETTDPALEPVEDASSPTASVARLDSGRQEFVTTEHDEGLTLALADNPDAKITSDTWERVER